MKKNRSKKNEIGFSYRAFSSCRGLKGNPDFEKFLFVGESGILDESVMWNSTNDLSSTDKESGDPVHEIRNPRCGIQSKTGLDSPGPKAFPSRHKGSL